MHLDKLQTFGDTPHIGSGIDLVRQFGSGALLLMDHWHAAYWLCGIRKCFARLPSNLTCRQKRPFAPSLVA